MANGLYIHIPFCKSKCPYCDFYSLALSKDLEDEYVSALVRNFSYCKSQHIDTIYFGGGTPSILSCKSYEKIFKSIKENFIIENAEITLEANPCSVDLEKLTQLRNIGFNRISFGVQSLVDSELIKLGRLHNTRSAINAVTDAYKAGFTDISCDLMLGIIGQTRESLMLSIDTLTSLPITHVSAYMLKIEPNTFYNNDKIISQLPSEDTVCELYDLTIESLKCKGFDQYEISNFAKKGFESKHNLKYWRCEQYLGFGPSAHSFFNGKRYYVPSDIEKYIEDEKQTEIVTEQTPHTFEEFAMLKLRLSEGLLFSEIESFGISKEDIIKKAQPMQKGGLVDINEKRIRITQKGFLVSNEIIVRLI